MNATFPLVTLRPIVDVHNAWTAMLLEGLPSGSGADLPRLFGELGLADALGSLSCIVVLPDMAVAVDSLPADRTVLSFPVALCCDQQSGPSLQALHAQGFRLMARGWPAPGQIPSAGVDSLALLFPDEVTSADKPDWLAQLSGPHLALATQAPAKVDSKRLQWSSGEFAADKPADKGSQAANQMLLLELLSQVVNDADSHEIEGTIKRDPDLSYHLLKLVNSAAFSRRTKITSFNQAITLLGRRQLQRWLQLLLYTHAGSGDMSNPLLPRAALRASLAEALCVRQGGSHDIQDRAFMVGMFSLLDRLLGKPFTEIVQSLNLADDVSVALTECSGPLGILLRATEAGENTPTAELEAILATAGLSHEDWARSIVQASRWAIQISSEA